MAQKPYRARSPLERLIVQHVVGIYDRKESPQIHQITELVMQDPRFYHEVMRDPDEARRVQMVGIERMVRNVLKGLRFVTGPYAGNRACLMIPVPGRRAGFLQFTSRAGEAELVLARDRRAAGARGLMISRDVLDEMVEDVRDHGVNTLEEVHGPMAVGL